MINFEIVGKINKENLKLLYDELDTELGHSFNLVMRSYVHYDNHFDGDSILPLVNAKLLNECGSSCCAIGFAVASAIGGDHYDEMIDSKIRNGERNYNYEKYSYDVFLNENVEMIVVIENINIFRLHMWEFLFGTENENCKYKLRERLKLVINDDYVGIYRYMEKNGIFNDCLID